MLTTFGNIIQRSQIPPQFQMLRYDTTNTENHHHYEHIIPFNRDFWITNILLEAAPVGASFATEMRIAIHAIGASIDDDVYLASLGPFTAAPAVTRINFPMAEGILIPRNTVIHAHITYNQAGLSKTSRYHLVGWLVKAYDMVML
jgi:hypothetical protein